MTPILFFDTETTGLPDWKNPSEAEHQPHIVQLAAILVDADTRELIEFMDVIIKPDGWVIPEETVAIHGITNERALAEGIPEAEALDLFLALHAKAKSRVAHNTTFDNRIIRIAMKRYRPDAVSDEQWKDPALYHCTMIEHSKKHGGKWPKLVDLYQHHFGRAMEGAHTALADAKGCMEVFFAALDAEKQAA